MTLYTCKLCTLFINTDFCLTDILGENKFGFAFTKYQKIKITNLLSQLISRSLQAIELFSPSNISLKKK